MSHVVQWCALALFLVLVAMLAGCENKTPRPKTEASAGASAMQAPVDPGAKTSAADAELAERVKDALLGDPQVGEAKLAVDANAGVVIIKGQVEKDETKQRIQELTQKVPGVKWVQNQVSVAPPPPSKAG